MEVGTHRAHFSPQNPSSVPPSSFPYNVVFFFFSLISNTCLSRFRVASLSTKPTFWQTPKALKGKGFQNTASFSGAFFSTPLSFSCLTSFKHPQNLGFSTSTTSSQGLAYIKRDTENRVCIFSVLHTIN